MDRKNNNPAKKRTRQSLKKKPEKTVKRAVKSRAAKKIDTELAQVDDKLHKMTAVLDHLSQGVCLFNKEDAVRYCNESFTRVTGLSIDSLKGKKLRKNQLWGVRGEKDQLRELFQQARESGTSLNLKSLPVHSSKLGERAWNIILSPLKNGASEYDGMALVIEDVTGRKPLPEESLYKVIYGAAIQHTGTQPLLDSLVTILKDYSACSSVKIVVLDRVRDRVLTADSDKQAGLWDMDRPLSPAEVDSMFKEGNGDIQQPFTAGGSILITDIQQCLDALTGVLKDTVTGLSHSYGFSSIAFVPLRYEDWINGFIQLANVGREIQPETVAIIENAGNQLHVLLEHSGFKEEMRVQREALLKQMNERNAHLEAVSGHLKEEMVERKKAQEEMHVQRDLALALNAIDDLDEALNICLDTAIRVSEMDCGGIYLVNEDSGEILLAIHKGVSVDFVRKASLYDKDSMNAEMVAQGKPLFLKPGDTPADMSTKLNAEGLKIVGIIPVIRDNKPVAILNIASHSAEEVSYNARNAVEAIAAQIGAVLTRSRHQQALSESEALYRTLFEHTGSPIFMIDPEGNYINGNDAALAFLECSREELLNMNVRDTLPPYLDESWMGSVRDIWQRGGTIERDYYVWGKIKIMEMTVTPLQAGDRRIVIGIGKDVTERKRMENELRKSEEEFRLHFENVYDVVFSVDLEGKILAISPSVERDLGYKPEEIIGKSLQELFFIDPQSLEAAVTNMGRIFAGETIDTFEYKMVTKGGDALYADISGAPLYQEGKVTGAVCVSRNITAHKQTEDALRKSEEKYRSLLVEMDEAYFEINMEGVFTDVNEAMARRCGYTREEFIGLRMRDITRPEDVESRRAMFADMVHNGGSRLWQPLISVKKDGSLIYVEDSIYLVRNARGEITGVRGIGRDVTERKKWESALQQSEEKFRRLFYEAPVGVAVASLDDLRLLSVNEALCKFTGYSAAELTSMSMKDLVHPDQVGPEFDSIDKLIRGEIEHYETDGRYLNKDGTYAWMHISVRLVRDAEGNPLHLLSIIEDISARKQAEEALQQSEVMFKSIVERISDVFYIQDKNGKLTYISPQVESILGYTAEEMSSGWDKYLSSSALNIEGLAKTQRALELGEKQEPYLMEFISKSGRLMIAEINESPLKDDGDNVMGMVGMARDVTEQVQSEALLKASEGRFRDIVEASPDPIWEVDTEGLFTYASPQMKAVLGYAPEDVLGKPLFSIIRPDEISEVAGKFREAQQPGGHLYATRVNVVGGDGRELIMEVRAAQMLDNQGNLKGFRGLSHDITEQVKFEKALQESEEKYRSMVENAGQGVFVLQDGTFKFANDRLINFSKYSRDELRQMCSADLLKAVVHPDNLQKVEEIYRGRMSGGQVPEKYELKWLDKDGEVKWAAIDTTQFTWEGKPAFLGFVTDITERRHIQKALSDSEEKYLTVLNEMQEYYYEVDPAGNFTFINEAAEPIFGYSTEELTGMNYRAYVPPEARKEMLTIASNVFTTGRPNYGMRVEHTRKDGTRFMVETSLLPVRNEKGEIVGLRGIGRDLTERIRAEQELQTRSLLLDSAVDSIVAFEFEGKIIYANEAACNSRGYTRDEMLQMVISQLIPESGLPDQQERMRAIREKGELIFEADHINRTGETFQVEAYSRLINVAGREIVVSVYRNITQRKLAERALKNSEARFRQLADLLPLVIVEADREGNITYVNKRSEKVLGYAGSELTGKAPVFKLVDDNSVEKAMSGMKRVLDGDSLGPQEYLFVRQDGSKFEGVVYSGRIMQGDDVAGARGVIVDISYIRKAEKELRESEEKYRSVVENAGEAIYVIQGDSIVYVNPRLLELTGYSTEEMCSRPFLEFVHPDDREIVKERYMARLSEAPSPDYYFVRIICKDESIIWIGLRATRIQWDGRMATLNLATDMTDFLKSQEALKDSEERYRLLADNAMDVIWMADMDLNINYISPSIRYMIGNSPENIITMYREGRLSAETMGMSAADGERILNALKALQHDASRTQVFEFEFKHRDGFTNWAEMKMSVMRDKTGKAAGILGIVRDITQQRKMTERLIRSDRLASLSEMAAGLAHEVNNPLTAVMGFAYLVQQNPNLPPEIKDDINSIYNEGKRAADVIKNFLTFARGHKPEKQAIFINDIIESTLRLRHSQMTKENVTVMVNFAEDLPAVKGDISQLQQVFLNIMLNAEHFMYQVNKKGTLSITTRQDEDRIKVYIQDDGPGIPQEKLSRVFDPFYTTKQVGEGTGLGLSICHGVVVEHGGAIYAESRPGEGATFIIELPAGK